MRYHWFLERNVKLKTELVNVFASRISAGKVLKIFGPW